MYLAYAPGYEPHGTPLDVQALGAWYDDIVRVVGDVGQQAFERIKQELLERYGAAGWQALPEPAKRAAIAGAWTDLNQRASWLPWAIAGASVLLLVWRR